MTFAAINYQPRGQSVSKSRKHYKPMDPVEIARRAAEARRDPGKWGLNEEAIALPANTNIVSEGEGRRNVARATRYNAFALLKSRDALEARHIAAIDRLADAIATRFKTEGSGGSGEKVDGGPSDFEGNVDRRLDAGDLLDDVLDLTGRASAKLLWALLVPQVTRGQPVKDWRAVIERTTGEIDHKRQTGQIRAACDNLCAAFATADKRKPIRRRAVTGAEVAA